MGIAAETEKPAPQLIKAIEGTTSYVVFSPDGQHLAGNVASEGWRMTDIQVWEIVTGRFLLRLKGHKGGIWKLTYSQDGKRLASNDNYIVKVWDLTTKKETLSFQVPAFTRSVIFTPDGAQLITADDNGFIRLWNAHTGKPANKIRGHEDQITCLALSEDGKQLATASVGLTAKIWDWRCLRELQTLSGHDWYLKRVAFGSHGARLITGSDDRTARVWDVATGRQLHLLGGHADWVKGVAISPNGEWLATSSSDHLVRIWDGNTGQMVSTIPIQTNHVAFSPNGRILATPDVDSSIKLWDMRSFGK